MTETTLVPNKECIASIEGATYIPPVVIDSDNLIFSSGSPLTRGYSKVIYERRMFEKGDNVEIKIACIDEDSEFKFCSAQILYFIKVDGFIKVVIRWYYNVEEIFNELKVKKIRSKKYYSNELFLSNIVQCIFVETINRRIKVVTDNNTNLSDYYYRFNIDAIKKRIKKKDTLNAPPYIIHSKLNNKSMYIIN